MQNDDIQLVLPFPPTINSYYSHSRYGVRISKKGREFRAKTDRNIREQIGTMAILDEPLIVSVILYPPDKRIRDLDNYIKPLFDAITVTEVIWTDDRLVDCFSVYRGERIREGVTRMQILRGGTILSRSLDFKLLS